MNLAQEITQVFLRVAEDELVREVVGQVESALRVGDHPEHGGHYAGRHLQGGGIAMGRQAPRLLNGKSAARPPGVKDMAHQERAQDVGAVRDIVL